MKYVFIFGLLGACAFFVGIGFLIFSAISGDLNIMPLFLGLFLMMILPIVGLLIDMRGSGKFTSSKSQTVSPIIRAEGGIPDYCPLCHANLGTNPPEKCPECGFKLKN